MSAPSPKLCLITGAGGFIGTAVTLAFLRAGHTVRGSFRTQAKADDWMHLHAAALDGRFEPVIVPDIAAPHAFDHAMESLDIVVHTASPVSISVRFHRPRLRQFQATLDPKDHVKEVLDPAYHGIMNLLHSAKHHKRIERFIFTR